MIVGSMFPGDEHEDLQLRQHDAYRQALRIIVQEAVERLRSAEVIAGQALPLGDAYRGREATFDHRDLQEVHDLLAAIWRSERGWTHPPLPLAEFRPEELVGTWLAWLQERVRGMTDHQVRLILVCAFGDDAMSCEAHSSLTGALRDELMASARRREDDSGAPA